MGTRHLHLPTPADFQTTSPNMSRIALVLALLCGAAYATQFKDCGSQGANPSFSVASCDTPPCTVKSGSKFPISMTFTPDHDIADLTAGVYAEIGGLDIPWPNFNNKACEKMVGEQCPLKKGVPATWTYEVFVDPLYPKMTVMAKFELKDNTGLQTCMEIPVVIEA